MQTEILAARVEFIAQRFAKPLQISSGTITEITEARAFVQVRVAGREAEGIGAIYLSDFWSWPQPDLTHAERDRRMRALCVDIARQLPEYSRPAAHPLELGLRLHEYVCHGPRKDGITTLAGAVCLSPFDAAIHDAVGRALGCSAFAFYDKPVVLPLADRYFPGESAAKIIRQTLRRPRPALDAWWLVGGTDALSTSFMESARTAGYSLFKIKILGRNMRDDLARTVEVYSAACKAGITRPGLSIDANEANSSSEQVSEFLHQLQADHPATYESLMYIEQPTPRDIVGHAYDWKGVSAMKPVILDEGLTSLDLLPLVKEQGWTGLALKTCKGHSFTLVAAAWAHRQGMPVAMQDLTNPGYSAIHSFLVAAHLNTMNGIELNSPQYTPEANAPWLPRRADLFSVCNGQHHLPVDSIIGLGADL